MNRKHKMTNGTVSKEAIVKCKESKKKNESKDSKDATAAKIKFERICHNYYYYYQEK